MDNVRLTRNIKYSVTARYMRGASAVGYHIVGENGDSRKVSREELIELIKLGVMENCYTQKYDGQDLLRGKGIRFKDLPIYDEKRQRIKGDNTNKRTRRDLNNVLGQLKITERIMNGVNCVGYVVENSGGVSKKLSREKVIELAKRRQIGNARVQMDNNRPILRGDGIRLDELPAIHINAIGGKTKTGERARHEIKYTIVSRLYQDNKCIGYVIVDNRNRKFKVTLQKLVELASTDRVKNASVKYTKGKRVLTGVGQPLSNLPIEYMGKPAPVEEEKNYDSFKKNQVMLKQEDIDNSDIGKVREKVDYTVEKPVSLLDIIKNKAHIEVIASVKTREREIRLRFSTVSVLNKDGMMLMKIVCEQTKEFIYIKAEFNYTSKITERTIDVMCCGIKNRYSTAKFLNIKMVEDKTEEEK